MAIDKFSADMVEMQSGKSVAEEIGSLSNLAPTPLSAQSAYEYESYKVWLDEQEKRQWDYGVSVKGKKYGAYGDGASHPVYPTYQTKASLQSKYPTLTDSFLTSAGLDLVANPNAWQTLEIDWCAIQSAINVAYEVRLPPGTYRISLNLIGRDKLNIHGSNRFDTIIKTYGCDGIVFDRKYYFHIHDLSFHNSDTVTYSNRAIILRNLSARYMVTNVNVQYYNIGMDLFDTNIGEFYSCFLQNNNTSTKLAATGAGYGCNAIKFYGCEFAGSKTGFWLESAFGSNLQGCTIEGNTEYGLRIDNTGKIKNFSVCDSYFELNEISVYATTLQDTHIDNCFFINPTTEETMIFFHINNVNRASIVNCTFSEALYFNHIEQITSGATPTMSEFTMFGNNVKDGSQVKINSAFTNVITSQGASTTNYIRNKNTEYSSRASKGHESWKSLTLSNGWTGNLQYTKNDMGTCIVAGYFTGGTKTWGTLIATLPEGYRPILGTVTCAVFADDGNVIDGIVIKTDGKIAIYNPATSSTNISNWNIHVMFTTV